MKTFFKNKKILLLIPFLMLSACSEKETSSTSEEEQKTVDAFLISRRANDSIYDLLNYQIRVEEYATVTKKFEEKKTKEITTFATRTVAVENNDLYLTTNNHSNFISTGRYFAASSEDNLVKTEELSFGVRTVTFRYFSAEATEKIIFKQKVPYDAPLPTTYNDFVYKMALLTAQHFSLSRTVELYDFGSKEDETGDLPLENHFSKEDETFSVRGTSYWFTIDGQNYYIGRRQVTKAEWQSWMEE